MVRSFSEAEVDFSQFSQFDHQGLAALLLAPHGEARMLACEGLHYVGADGFEV
jgi:hypothetical protein